MSLLGIRFLSLVLAPLVALPSRAPADPVLPGNVLDPQSAAEAWNVIRLSTRNVERLLDEKRFDEVPLQISFCSPALRALPRFAANPEAAARLRAGTGRASVAVISTARAAEMRSEAGTLDALAALRSRIKELASEFGAETVNSEIFFCPMHPDLVSERPTAPCGKCGMALAPRRIPYSFIYVKPGEPTVTMTASASGPAEAGRRLDVKVRLESGGGKPVLPEDLLVTHTQPIHLLIETPGLSDYHREHPVPTGTPGEYAFSFTPARSTPYRVWADIVPASTGVQELPHADIASVGPPDAIQDRTESRSSEAGGFRFDLTLAGGRQQPICARETRAMSVSIADTDGNPVKRLQPVMSAFAHLVGFYDDHLTVVHLHPAGGDILDASARGGPVLDFKFHPPKAGFIRLYCQASIDGKTLYVPFNINVLP